MHIDENGIYDVPVLELVPIVRCKDCIHGLSARYGYGYDPRAMKASDVRYCNRYRMCHFEDYYCADGKRKETEDGQNS